MNDVLARLRAADPAPSSVAYDDSVAQRNIDAIVRTDFTVRPAVRPPRRSRLVLAVAAVVVLLVGAGTVVWFGVLNDDARPSGADGPWVTFAAGGLTFDHPAAWESHPPGPASGGGTATLADLSTLPLPEPCVSSTQGEVESMVCRSPVPDLGGGGVFVEWQIGGLPGAELTYYRGEPTTVDGFPARVDRSAAPDVCLSSGAVAGAEAAVEAPRNQIVTMTACIGPGDVDASLAAVDRMLASVRISG